MPALNGRGTFVRTMLSEWFLNRMPRSQAFMLLGWLALPDDPYPELLEGMLGRRIYRRMPPTIGLWVAR